MKGKPKVLYGWEHETLEAKVNRALKMSYTERYREMVEFTEFIDAARGEQSLIDDSGYSLGEKKHEQTFRSVQILKLPSG